MGSQGEESDDDSFSVSDICIHPSMCVSFTIRDNYYEPALFSLSVVITDGLDVVRCIGRLEDSSGAETWLPPSLLWKLCRGCNGIYADFQIRSKYIDVFAIFVHLRA